MPGDIERIYNKWREQNADSLARPTDDDYLSQIEQYRESNPELYQYLLTNPHMFSKKADFAPTFAQQISEQNLGDFSARKRYWSDILQEQNNFLTEGIEKFRQQDYNSASAQVQRERAAGLNPDLNGQVTPGDAAENDQPMLEPVQMSQDSAVAQFSNGVLDFVGKILSFGSQIQGLNLNMQNIISSELGSNQSAFDFVSNQIASLSPLARLRGSSDYKSSVESLPDYLKDSSMDAWLDNAIRADYSGYSMPTRKLIKRYYGLLKRGDSMAVEEVKSRLMKNILQNKKESVAIAGSPIFDDDFNKWLNNFVSKVGQIEYDMWKLGVSATNAESESRKAAAEASVQEQGVNESVNAAWNKLYSSVSGDKWYNTIAMLLLPILRIYLERGFSFSKGQSSSSSIGKNSSSSSKSTSFGLSM